MKGSLLQVSVSAAITFVIHYMEKYVFSDWNFLGCVITLIIVDTVIGFAANWVRGTVSSNGWRKLFKKIIEYGSALIIAHVLTSFEIQNAPTELLDWADDVIYSAILVAEAISIGENAGKIGVKGVLTRFLKRLKEFDAEGKFINNEDSTK